ncbi:MAG: hypothetical protein Kow0032_20240 [Methyloligellaceae bacterium]
MHETSAILEIAALLVAGAFAAVALCVRLGLPPIIGYLAAGVALGPSGLHLVTEGEALSTLGEVGVILLLFTLGLEFSFARIVDLRHHIFGLGTLQVAFTGGIIAGFLLGTQSSGLIAAVLIGGAAAMSSTALCLKTLAREHALQEPQGRLAISVLLFQDLAAVGLLVVHDAALGQSAAQGLTRFLLGSAGLAAALFLARGVLQALARWIASVGDVELAQLLALAISLLSAIAAIMAGLSPALGAFAAGMMISEGDARNVVEKEIRPFRDLLVGFFFVGIGAQLQLETIGDMAPAVLAWLFVLLAVKLVIVSAIIRLAGEPWPLAWRAGTILAHGGEFGMMLLSVGAASGLIDAQLAMPLLLAIGISLFPATLMIRLGSRSSP